MDGLEHGRHLRPLRFGDLRQRVAVEMHRAALVFGLGEDLGDRAAHAGGLVADDRANAAQAARSQPRQEIAPAFRRLGEALGAADHLAVTVVVHADGYRDGDVLVGAASAALQVDAVDIDVRVLAFQRPALHSSTALKALSLRFDTVPAEMPAPHRISLTSPMRRVDAPAKYISMMASSTLVSRLL